ncbi:hypothetical protein [uncultured Nostoc sp.]
MVSRDAIIASLILWANSGAIKRTSSRMLDTVRVAISGSQRNQP